MENKNFLIEEEKQILRFWQKQKIFEKSLEQRKGKKKFVFYEGPPGTNAKPGIHHALSRIYKDVICRFKTMAGFYVERKAGWDTHGLPIELQAEKELGFQSKKDILNFGIEKFNQKCRELVFTYKKDWEEMTKKNGFWLDLDNPYITLENKYIERLWQVIKRINQKKLLYREYKISPYCPRCQTVLSSHEVAQGYKKVKEPAIFIKFPIVNFPFPNSYFLVWTTTPWTLPANMAIALNKNFNYALAKKGNQHFILLKEKVKEVLGNDWQIIKTIKGKNLLGLKYQPIFKNKNFDFFKTINGDFVSREEGTGLVHIAPAFGEDDMMVMKKIFKTKLEFPLTVDENGLMKTPGFKWNNLFVKEADPLIIDYLKKKKILFKEESYEHDYPFCWRCATPLLYYPKESWFIKMSALRKELLKNNEKINWLPSHIKKGRFGQWLKEIKDWAFSRERFWGTPLPIWQDKEKKEIKVIGSLKELKENSYYQNTFYLLRHGEAETNRQGIVVSQENSKKYHLTKKGKEQIKKVAKLLKKEKIDLIFASPLTRTKETAKIVAEELKVPLFFEKRLQEINVGIFNGKKIKDYQNYFQKREEKIEKKPPKGENWQEVAKRIIPFIEELNRKYQNKKILIVSHQDPLIVIQGKMEGLSWQEIVRIKEHPLGKIRKFNWAILPFNENLEIDLHRPYIDKIILKSSKGEKMKRDERIADVWFDSGAMPYAQKEWNWQNLKKNDFPADYICEGIDQTRGWFYTLLAVSTALNLGHPFKNVICLGLVLDEKGQKMSKSKGNVVDPLFILEKYGADALRWYFFTINPPGENKKFSEKGLADSLRRFILTYWNIFNFWQTYRPKNLSKKLNKKFLEKLKKPKDVLNLWIVSRWQESKEKTFNLMNKFLVHQAAMEMENFLDDFSRWYLRRARKKLQKQKISDWQVFSYLLGELTKTLAPFIPFLTEKIWQKLSIDQEKESVHLADFPKVRKDLLDKKIIEKMAEIRKIAKYVLFLRQKAGIKIKQPLAWLKIETKKKIEPEFLKLLGEEVNVKRVLLAKISEKEKKELLYFDEDKNYQIVLNQKITFALKIEGKTRELIRLIQKLRGELQLRPENSITLGIKPKNEESQIILQSFSEKIKKEVRAKKFFAKKLKNFDLLRENEDWLITLKK